MLTPEKINEMAIDSYLTDPLKPVVCMTDDALHHFAGAIESLANQEKDADIERLKCAHSDMAEMYRKSQEHVTELSAMTEGQREVLTDLEDRLEKAQSEFKNFHRALCERFNYCHDQADWKRDQVSLIEHIANSLQSSQSQATGKVQVSGRNKEIIVSVDGEIQFIKQIDETPLAFSHVVRSSQSQVSDELSKVIKFLLGEGELDGLWFGDSDTDKPRPRYWWRAELRERFEALQSIPSAKGGE